MFMLIPCSFSCYAESKIFWQLTKGKRKVFIIQVVYSFLSSCNNADLAKTSIYWIVNEQSDKQIIIFGLLSYAAATATRTTTRHPNTMTDSAHETGKLTLFFLVFPSKTIQCRNQIFSQYFDNTITRILQNTLKSNATQLLNQVIFYVTRLLSVLCLSFWIMGMPNRVT